MHSKQSNLSILLVAFCPRAPIPSGGTCGDRASRRGSLKGCSSLEKPSSRGLHHIKSKATLQGRTIKGLFLTLQVNFSVL